jgi:type VI secretion system protein ImpC
VGVLAELSGQPETCLTALEDRKFLSVNRGVFDAFLAYIKPRLAFSIANRLGGRDAWLEVELRFHSMADFEPDSVVQQVEPLRRLRERGGGHEAISRQLDAILHAPEFQKLEVAWRGLHYLVSETPEDSGIKIYVLNADKQELLQDFRQASQLERSVLFRKLCTEVYGCLGAEPFSLLVGDFHLNAGPGDMELLERISQVAAAAHAPLIAATGPDMFQCQQFSDLAARRDFERGFEDARYARWRSFRESPEADYMALTLPRVLLRMPYSPEAALGRTSFYQEELSDPGSYPWGNAAYVFATRLTRAFALHRWCAAIQGMERGGLVTGLPVPSYVDEHGDVVTQCPVEIALNEAQEWKLFHLGFNCLVHWKGTDKAVFFSAVTCLKPRQYLNEAATKAASLAARLPYVLAVSRFAHYLKVITRDTLGGFDSPAQCEEYLTEWISEYVLADDSASEAVRASHPLQEARIDVAEDPGKPGTYAAVAFLRPRFQLEDLGMSIRLVVELPHAPLRWA